MKLKLISPSLQNSDELISDDQLAKWKKMLSSMWLEVWFGQLNHKTAQSRADEVMSVFKDNSIDWAIALTWWWNGNEILPYLDYDLIKNNPKPLIWFSDITVLLNSIYLKTWVKWIHWPNFHTLIKMSDQWSSQTLLSLKNTIDWITQYRNDLWMRVDPWFKDNQWNMIEMENRWSFIINEWVAKWKIIWWNVPSLILLAWSKYAKAPTEEYLLFVEDDNYCLSNQFDETTRQLESLFQSWRSEQLKWLIFWRFQYHSEVTYEKLQTFYKNRNYLSHIPVIANVDFWHTYPMRSFTIGGEWSMSAKKINNKDFISLIT